MDVSFHLGHLLVLIVMLAAALVVLRKQTVTERHVLLLVLMFMVLAGVGWVVGTILEAVGHPVSGSTMRAFGMLFLGLSYISLATVILFGGLLPGMGLQLPRIARDLTVGAANLMWGVIFLQWENVNLAGIIATTSVLTVVIGLAMQDTLGNLISGLALQLDDSLHVGDWIKLNDLKGQVVETRWRFTAIETTNWETVIIPNSILMKNVFVVLGRRQGQPVQWRHWVYFNVDYRTAPTVVIEAVEKALRTAKMANVAETPQPNCIHCDFSDSYARYAVRYWLTSIKDDDPTDCEIRSHIYFALKRLGIHPSIPAATVFLNEESEQREATKLSQKIQGRVQALRNVDLFRELPADELETVAMKMQVVPYAKGDYVTRQGSVAHFIYLLISGDVEIWVQNEAGESAKVAEIGPGSLFGEYGAMTGQPRDASVIANVPVEVYRLDIEAFRSLLQERPALAEELSAVLAARRTSRQAALEHLDEAAHSKRLTENRHEILESVRKLFGLTA